jgi:iron complex transport system ATP-binding protein
MTILGKNGIVKTTLIKCMSGILKWNSGKTIVNGKEFSSVKDIKRVAFVPQAHQLPYPYTVRDVVIMGRVRHMGLLSIPSKRDKEIADNTLQELEIADLAERSSTRLSGGQLQLVFIDRALASEPEVLVMDEPESHLDFRNQYFILHLIERLVREKGLSCIINTHYPDHALRISDQTLLLGKNCSCFGNTRDILTEENIREYFDVRAKIADIFDNDRTYRTFVVLDSY